MALARRLLAVLVLLPVSLPSSFGPAAAQEGAIVVEAPGYRAEIERILEADNLDIAMIDAPDVVEWMRRIPKGNAPDDFWTAYQAHVAAWQRFVDRSRDVRSTESDLLTARRSVNSTFDRVERIARNYGAGLPRPTAQNREGTNFILSVSSRSS
jgi:hypothetical protein